MILAIYPLFETSIWTNHTLLSLSLSLCFNTNSCSLFPQKPTYYIESQNRVSPLRLRFMVNNPNMFPYYPHHHHDHHNFVNFDHGLFGNKNMIMKDDQLKLIKRAKLKLFSLIFLCFFSCTLIWLPLIIGFPFPLSYIIFANSPERENFAYENLGSIPPPSSVSNVANSPERENFAYVKLGSIPPPSSVSNGTIHCDRSHYRTDICYMKGDIRTHSPSSSIFSYTDLVDPRKKTADQIMQHETIRPYTRKWETSVMDTIDQLNLLSKYIPSFPDSNHECEIIHDVPAIFFSTGGYTGNVYHEFNDGIIPLYITSQQFDKKVVFVILEFHDWWYTKYAPILSQLSDYPIVDFQSDPRTHCFREAIVGLKIHDELTIDGSLTKGNKNIRDFRNLLGRAFGPSLPSPSIPFKRPKLVILSRKGSRSITNEHSLVKLAHKVGFNVQVLKPNRNTELASIYSSLSTSDVMVGVHGAGMTHLLFLKPSSVLIQVIPLGTDWASETYYGEPAKKLGLKYIGYKINPIESSLYRKYKKNDPILADPNSVNEKGWEFTKRIYLDDQNVSLDLKRFKKLLVQAYENYGSSNRS